jgi:hypothetical protein
MSFFVDDNGPIQKITPAKNTRLKIHTRRRSKSRGTGNKLPPVTGPFSSVTDLSPNAIKKLRPEPEITFELSKE